MSLTIAVWPLVPVLAPVTAALLVLVADLFDTRTRLLPYAIGLVGLLVAAVGTVPGLGLGAGSSRASFCLPDAADLPALGAEPARCFWRATALGSSLQLAAVVAAVVCLLLAWPGSAGSSRTPRSLDGQAGSRHVIDVVLLLGATAGAVAVPAARELGTWLVALELATLPAVAMVAMGRRRAAAEGGVQLLVTSVLSFALLVLGAGFWFLATGSVWLTGDASLAVGTSGHRLLALGLGVALLVAGLGFKLSLVPFHAWTPVAFAGADTPVAMFLATVSKVAALGALVALVDGLAALGRPGALAVGLVAAATMTVGNLVALRQTDTVRLLAWSTVAQAGWVLLPLANLSAAGAAGATGYLLALVVATLVAFSVVRVAELRGAGRSVSDYAGLWRRSPWLAGALGLALTSLAGLPPGVVGLVAKISALQPVLRQGWVWLALVAAVNVVLGIAVYLRWFGPVFLPPSRRRLAPIEKTTEDDQAGAISRAPLVGLALATLTLVVVSVQPDLLLRWLT